MITSEDYFVLWKIASLHDALAESVIAPLSFPYPLNAKGVSDKSPIPYFIHPFRGHLKKELKARLEKREEITQHIISHGIILQSFKMIDSGLLVNDRGVVSEGISWLCSDLESLLWDIQGNIESNQGIFCYPASVSRVGFHFPNAPKNIYLSFNPAQSYEGAMEEVQELKGMACSFKTRNDFLYGIRVLKRAEELFLPSLNERLRKSANILNRFGFEINKVELGL